MLISVIVLGILTPNGCCVFRRLKFKINNQLKSLKVPHLVTSHAKFQTDLMCNFNNTSLRRVLKLSSIAFSNRSQNSIYKAHCTTGHYVHLCGNLKTFTRAPLLQFIESRKRRCPRKNLGE